MRCVGSRLGDAEKDVCNESRIKGAGIEENWEAHGGYRIFGGTPSVAS